MLTMVEHVVIGAVQLVVVPPVGVIVGVEDGVTQMSDPQVVKTSEVVAQLLFWPLLHEVPVVMKAEHVVIGEVQDDVVGGGVTASTVLLVGGLVNGIVLVEVIVVEPSLHWEQGCVTVCTWVYVLQVDVTVVMPPTQVVHATVCVVTNGAVGVGAVIDGVPLEIWSAATGVLLEVTVEVTGTVLVTWVVESVVFMLVVVTPLVVMVHGAVIVIVESVVKVLMLVTVLTAGVLSTVTVEVTGTLLVT